MVELKGVYTAIITPFKGTGVRSRIDWDALARLVDFQNEGGVAGIVPCGTTGESPTLSHEEHNKVIEEVIERAKGQVIAGTGSNCTWEAIAMSKHAADAGATATLQVCPYYNKPSQEGLFRHFGAIAEAVDIPHVLYNIPGRTSRLIEPETIARLMNEYSNIIGVKEATGNEEVWKKTRQLCGDKFIILSGDDNKTYTLMRNYGCLGVISVASNIAPRMMVDFIKLGLDGNWPAMEAENARLSKLFEVLFIDTNPIPVKEAAKMMGLCGSGMRLPMCETSKENREKIRSVISEYGLIK
ncbi:MAG: 4-hydroxy-tetrahydrodipicolinate synthase [Candidatus Micrarchaeia archaeon]